MKRKLKYLLYSLGIFSILYLLGAFVVTPPFSEQGIYRVDGISCGCGHRVVATFKEGKMWWYTHGHNERDSGISYHEINDSGKFEFLDSDLSNQFIFDFWGMQELEQSKPSHLSMRDYAYPFSLWTIYQADRKAE